jgi:TusE/DsrC/DsvC family sulfur relay protein
MSTATLQLPGGKRVAIDEKGYLADYRSWTPEVAAAMATADGIELTREHWFVLDFFRQYFERHEVEPPMRAVVRQVRAELGEEKGSSRFLYLLFPDGPTKQASRYAGLPRPLSCI